RRARRACDARRGVEPRATQAPDASAGRAPRVRWSGVRRLHAPASGLDAGDALRHLVLSTVLRLGAGGARPHAAMASGEATARRDLRPRRRARLLLRPGLRTPGGGLRGPAPDRPFLRPPR